MVNFLIINRWLKEKVMIGRKEKFNRGMQISRRRSFGTLFEISYPPSLGTVLEYPWLSFGWIVENFFFFGIVDALDRC